MPHSQKVCNANQIFQLYQGIDISTKKRSTKMPLCERTRYRKQASTVRNMRAVLKKASWGTRRIFGSIRCKKQAFPVRKRYSVPKTVFSGTRRISKARRTADSTDCGQPPAHRTHLQCAKRPRSEVSRHKKKRPKSKTLISFVGVL